MEGEACYLSMRPTDLFPFSRRPDLTADCASSVLHHCDAVSLAEFENCVQITGHAHLVNAQDSPGPIADGFFDTPRRNVKRRRIDVHENGPRSTVANAVRGRDIRMAHRYDFVPWTNPNCQQCEVEGRCSTRNRTCVRCTHKFSEFTLESRDLGTLRYPTRQNRPSSGGNFLLAEMRARHRNKILRHGSECPAVPSYVRLPAPVIPRVTSPASYTSREAGLGPLSELWLARNAATP